MSNAHPTLNIDDLLNANRLLVMAKLRVAEGWNGRFQATGYPNLGSALYKGVRYTDGKPQTVEMLSVDSNQAIVNWLESVCLAGEVYNTDCQGIPYVRVVENGDRLVTTSVLEPHRLASDRIMDAQFNNAAYRMHLERVLSVNKKRPLRLQAFLGPLFEIDPGCVLHGVFLERLDGRMRLPRLVSGFVEAGSPNQVNTGGLMRGYVTIEGEQSSIPYPRQDFSSTDIKASFIFHLSTLRDYQLAEGEADVQRKRFLIAWMLYKIDRFLHRPMRPRSACEFELVGIEAKQDGTERSWPEAGAILAAFQTVKGVVFPPLNGGRVTTVTHAGD
ncbi:MAG: type I-U CRISPR-associated protein Cas7 [Verrucomicrobia bacterium]|nr:type I-U CRISPR-associated protein Cas7 [Verrucomicrobiota bacterium]